MSTQLNTTKYMELENIFQYSVRPELNMDFKTCCIVLDKSKLDTSAKYIIQVFKKYISTEIAQNADVTTYLKDVSAKLASDDIEESHVTLQVSGGKKGGGMLNIILLTYDADLLTTRSLYRFNESLRGVGGHIYNSLHKNELRNFNLIVPGENKMCNDYLLKVLEGFLLAMYSFNKYKSGDAGEKKELPEFRDQVLNTIKLRDTKTKKAGLVMGGAVENKQTKKVDMISMRRPKIKRANPNNYAIAIISKDSKLQTDIGRLVTIIKSVYTCRDLINEPGNILTTASMGKYLKKMIEEHKIPVDIEIYDRAACAKMGMGLLVAVGEGNPVDRQSGLIILKYNGLGSKGKQKGKGDGICMIGKGITQDTGGYSLKPTSDIPSMKSDKSGAAIVLTSILCSAKLGLPVNLIGMLPMAQNSIGPGSMVPGDILTAYNGMTVEVSDPDAEGRLIIADCLAYAADKWPKYQLLDVATLTGEQEAISCKKFSTLIHVNSEAMADKLVMAGEEEGERVVKMPYMSDFIDTIKSDVADVRNTSSTCNGDIYPSSLFMSSFLKPDSKWIHIDLGGNTFEIESEYLESGALASGVGVKLLMNVLTSL
jgi:leucyl aminopeptidase